jgi:hypothetical protein
MPTVIPSINEVQGHFARLEAALAKRGVLEADREVGHTDIDQDGYRSPKAGEFMFMQIDERGVAGFKHRLTRNYVFLSADGVLIVPKTANAFMRGQF